ncbi:hypothetical protein [Schauerella aestuarii]|uniref:hypothetical protein n=1 Tax=Schauerella aestuarii TaxID=2511204 RepID=UPI00136843B4|nr:hypothetical protein [Achromobacter aestuarii]MYZ42457.1 hypothetical protein [Achromobacter aestuarii]
MSSVEEAEALSKKKSELHALAAKVASLAERRGLLERGGVPLSQSPDVEKARQSCAMILTRFMESPKAATLVDKQRWIRLTESIGEFNTVEETLQKYDWKGYCGSRLFGGLPPEQREQTILMTLQENQEALALYRRLHKRLLVHRAGVPDTTEALEEVQECSRQLSEIRFVENQDVPSEVRAFFDATSSASGANLELLTTDVVNWLSLSGMLKNFSVRAR